MTPAARFIAVVVGVIGLVVGMAALVRAAVLAAEPGLTWSLPGWWTTVSSGSGLATSVAAGVTAAVAAALLILAVRQLRSRSAERVAMEFGGNEGQARLAMPALEKALQRSVRSHVDGVGGCRVRLSRDPAGWFARVEAVLPARDLLGVQERITRQLQADLDRLGGVRLEGVDLIVAGVTGLGTKAVAEPVREGPGASRAS